jgi:hypothetical protein
LKCERPGCRKSAAVKPPKGRQRPDVFRDAFHFASRRKNTDVREQYRSTSALSSGFAFFGERGVFSPFRLDHGIQTVLRLSHSKQTMGLSPARQNHSRFAHSKLYLLFLRLVDIFDSGKEKGRPSRTLLQSGRLRLPRI